MDSDAIRDPARYEPDPSLIDAIHAAIILGQPLLLAGEPGCGKTEVANFVAYQFGLHPPAIPGERREWALRLDVKSTTTARDLFYSFDTVGRFGAAKDEGPAARRPGRFITLSALGRAIMDAAPWSEVRDIEIANYRREHDEPRRSVVLIDEIDKAPRDVPNDLLMEIERLGFRITELNREGDRPVRADPDHRPVLIITSNSERALPDAFLRRCIFHYMAFPDRDRLGRIVEARIPGFPRGSDLERDALALLFGLRAQTLLKLPGTAELLGFLAVLLANRVSTVSAVGSATLAATDAVICSAALYDLPPTARRTSCRASRAPGRPWSSVACHGQWLPSRRRCRTEGHRVCARSRYSGATSATRTGCALNPTSLPRRYGCVCMRHCCRRRMLLRGSAAC
jgi:MoxR-like ATPase